MDRNDFNELAAATVFLQVVKARGFANAARAIGKSPSALTRAVAELERQLGTALLTRTTRRIHLTEAGALYVQHAEAMLAAQRQAHDAVSALTGGRPRGHLRVSMPTVVGERLLGPRLGEFHARCPELVLELDLADRVVPLVQGGFDLALRVGRLADSAQRAQRLVDVSQVLVASPGYLARAGAPREPADLLVHPCITQRQLAGPVEWRLYREDQVVALAVSGWLGTTSATLVEQAAVAGHGIARISAWVARESLRSGRLVRVLLDWSCHDPREEDVGLHVVYAQGAGVDIPLKSRVFVAWVKEIVGGEVAAGD